MSLTTVSFSISESIGLPNFLTFTDNSSGTDNTITQRKIFMRLSDGTYLLNGTTWSYNDASITIDVLTQSTAANVTVQWLNSGGTILYEKTVAYVFNVYDYLFAYEKLQDQAATLNPNILQDVNFYESCIKLITNIFNSEVAISLASDVTGSQFALARNQALMASSNLFF